VQGKVIKGKKSVHRPGEKGWNTGSRKRGKYGIGGKIAVWKEGEK